MWVGIWSSIVDRFGSVSRVGLLSFFALAASSACASPTIIGFSPASGAAGTQVTIHGTSFGATQGSGSIQFNGTAVPAVSWNDTSIVVTLPSGVSSGPFVVVNDLHVSSTSSTSFTVMPSPKADQSTP